MANGLVLDYNKGKRLCERLIKAFEESKFLQNKVPETKLPSGVEQGSVDQALYLFFAVGFDQLRDSAAVYRDMRILVERIGNPKKLLEMTGTEIRANCSDLPGLDKGHENSIGRPFEAMVENAQKIKVTYRGNPLNIFSKVNNPCDVFNQLQDFRSYGPGKAALLVKNFVKIGALNFSDADYYSLPIKVDRHVVRISYGQSVISKLPKPRVYMEGRFKGELSHHHTIFPEPLRKLYQSITSNHKIDPLKLDDAFWAIGSTYCVNTRMAVCEKGCPLGEVCSSMPGTQKSSSYLFFDIDSRKIPVPADKKQLDLFS